MKSRWSVLAILGLCVYQFTLNWFCIVPAFPSLAREFHLAIPEVAALIAAFLGGYGICHLPAGWFSARIGMRGALLTGVAIEAVSSVLSPMFASYPAMIALRVVAGAGGACCLGASVGLVSAWFRDRELSLAMGLTTGVAFALGAASGLFVWEPVVGSWGWRGGLAAAGALGLVVLLVAACAPLVPQEERHAISAGHLDAQAVGRVLKCGALWWWGLSIIGSYGAFFTAAQFLPIYAVKALGFTPAQGGSLGATLLLSGIPAALLGGWIADRFGHIRLLICGAFVVSGAVMIGLPFLDHASLYVGALAIGLITMVGLTPWFSVPAMYPGRITLADVPAASGLMLTLAALGGFLVPIGFGHLVATHGFSAGWTYLGIVSIAFTMFGMLAPAPRGEPRSKTSTATA